MSAQASPFDARPPSGKQFYCAVFLRWLAGQVCLRLSGILPATLGVIWMVSGPCAVASRLPSRGDRPRSVRDEIRQWRGDYMSGPHNTGSGGETPAAAGGVGSTGWGEGPCLEAGAPALGRMITPLKKYLASKRCFSRQLNHFNNNRECGGPPCVPWLCVPRPTSRRWRPAHGMLQPARQASYLSVASDPLLCGSLTRPW